jgi:hypothetical protein
MVQLATNNAYALVPGAVSSVATSTTIETGKGALFPILGTGDYFYATLVDVVGNYEIIKVTARTGDLLTFDRAQQGTLALPFPANSRIELRVTAGSIVGEGGGGGGTVASADVTYTPSTLANWTDGVDPGQVDDALDQLATRVVAAEDSPEDIIIACSDETTALTTGTAKVTFRMPYTMTLDQVRASLSTAQSSGSIFTVDINDGGTSVLSTKITIDNTEKTSTTAAALPVISDSALANNAEITIDIDQVGDGTAKGLKVILSGIRA